jgi:hypothetical protein
MKNMRTISGGIGSKLKRNKKRLMYIPYFKTVNNKILLWLISKILISGSIIIKNINNNANKKFENGPTNETIASPILLLKKLFGFTGTGFAQPIKAIPDENEASGIKTVPIKSICLSGLRDNLPTFFAVGSPILYAKSAWANS